MPKASPAIDRMMARVIVTPGLLDSPCWVCTLRGTPNGYSTISVDGRPQYVYRFSYEHHVGPIPDGLEIDHLCRMRACVNPAHLEAVTHRENVQRSEHPNIVIARTGLCAKGHDQTDAYRRPDGRPKCRECSKERDRNRPPRTKGC